MLNAARRARQIEQGAEPLVPMGKEKPVVIALREIGEGKIDPKKIEQIQNERNLAQSQVSEAQIRKELAHFAEKGKA